jgi:MFS family permease
MSEPTSTVRWRSIAIPAYGPTILVSIGQGATLPLVALSARDLGASVGVAAFVVALIGIGQLLGDLPAGALAARVGEQKALVAACAVDALALAGAFLARSLWLLALAIFVTGLAGAVFSLARQAYLTETVPVRMRARALSTLGGTFRVGLFVGPFVGAALVAGNGIAAAYAFAAVMSLAAAGLTAFLPDVTRTRRSERAGTGVAHSSVLSVLRAHRHTLLTLGTGVLIISAARATRQTIVPLWAASQGLSPSTVSLVYGVSAGVDMLLFYPGGAIMDRYGRVFVAVPSMLVLGLGFLLLPLTHVTPAIAAVAGLMGLGNGISAGVVMTLGADAAPVESRAQFLGGWRLCADLGNATGPLIVSAVSAVAPLAAAAVTMGVLTWVGVGWLARFIPRHAGGPPEEA